MVLRYRVDVVAASVADVVRGAGGWIFDRTMQGWAVNVVVPQPGDTRPIAILGATVNEAIGSEHPAPQVFLDDASGTEVVEHRLSTAARLFKAQALIAARTAPMPDTRETLFFGMPSAEMLVEVIELQPFTVALPS